MSTLPQTIEDHHAWVVDHAEYYTAVRFLGRGQWLREERPDFQAALAAGKEINVDRFRGVLIYAVYRTHQALVAVINPHIKGKTMISVIVQFKSDKSLKIVQVNHDNEIERIKTDHAQDDAEFTVVQSSADLEKFSLSELVRMNNILSQHQVKSFGTKEKGVKRVYDRLTTNLDADDAKTDTGGTGEKEAESGAAAPPSASEESNDMARAAATGKAPKGRKPKKVAPKEAIAKVAVAAAEAKRAPKAGGGRRSRFGDGDRIQILVDGNPKREGSNAAEWFETQRKVAKLKNPTIGECKARGVPMGDITWNVDKGFIKVIPG
jgi:hypothetical protein